MTEKDIKVVIAFLYGFKNTKSEHLLYKDGKLFFCTYNQKGKINDFIILAQNFYIKKKGFNYKYHLNVQNYNGYEGEFFKIYKEFQDEFHNIITTLKLSKYCSTMSARPPRNSTEFLGSKMIIDGIRYTINSPIKQQIK